MKKLITLTAYVLEQNKTSLPLWTTNWNKEFETRFKNIVNYAKFLSMPLTEELLYKCIESIHSERVIFYLCTYSTFEELAINHNNLTLTPEAIQKYKF